MEFFVCPCPGRGDVFIDGVNLGPNKDENDKLKTKQCEEGERTVRLECHEPGKKCVPPKVDVEIRDTNPIDPLKVPFVCV